MEGRHLSLSEVAGSMGVSERTVRRWIKSGKLKAYKPGRDYRIPESALREFVEESEIRPKASASAGSGLLEGYDPETWRRRLAYYRGILEIHLQGWEEAAATLRTRKVPFHEGWARTVRQAVADDWNWLKGNDLPEDLETLMEVAEAGDGLPRSVREEAAKLSRALERLGNVPRLVVEAEREALMDRSEGEPGDVTNLVEEREKRSRDGIPLGTLHPEVFEEGRSGGV